MGKRLTKEEERSQDFCEVIKNASIPLSFAVVWKKSRTWGYCPHLYNSRRERVASMSGCGYDKLSAVLAAVLHPLGATEQARLDIHGQSGGGLPAVRDALARHGWVLTHVHDGPIEDGFTIARKEGES